MLLLGATFLLEETGAVELVTMRVLPSLLVLGQTKSVKRVLGTLLSLTAILSGE